MPGDVARFFGRSGEPRRRNLLDLERVERPGEIGREPKRFRRALAAAPDETGQSEQALGGVYRGRQKLVIGSLEAPAHPFVELGVADRYQPRQQQSRPAFADERLGHGAHRAVVGKQDPPLGQRQGILAEAVDQPARE